MTLNQPKLTYFDIRGRAEPIRLLLEELGVPYEDRRIAIQEWPALKETLPFGQVPLYEEGVLAVPQSHAILRHLARKHDRYGRGELERTRCDVVEEAIAEAHSTVSRLQWDPQFHDKRQAFVQALPSTLVRLQRCLEGNAGSPGFWVGDQPTYVDGLAFTYLDVLRPLAAEVVADFTALSEFKARYMQRPRIAHYLASGRRPATHTVPMAQFGGTPETS